MGYKNKASINKCGVLANLRKSTTGSYGSFAKRLGTSLIAKNISELKI
jgi:hypothetical protein